MYVSYADLAGRRPSPILPMHPDPRVRAAVLARSGAARSPVWLPGSPLPAVSPYPAGRAIARPAARSSAPWPVFPRQAPRAGIATNGGWIHPGSPMRPGLGQVSTQAISQIAATGATTTISTLVALGAITGPVGAAVAGLVAVGTLLASVFKGCGQTCVEASDIANQVGSALQQNLQQYLSSPVHYQSLQTAALNNFQTAWTALTQACGAASLASAGQNCISERQQGACSYKTTPGGWQQTGGTWTYVYPGANHSGSTCWNYFVGFHDPIANDPTVVPDPATPSGAAATATSFLTTGLTDVGINPNTTIFGIPISTLALPAALLVAVLLLMD